jgi:hypothetical protein
VVIRAIVAVAVVTLVMVMVALVVMVLLVTGRVIGAVARDRHAAATDRHHTCNRECR